MSKLSFAEVLSSYSAVTRSLNLNMKQVPQGMVFQAISLVKQGKSVLGVEELTGLSKSTAGRLRKSPLHWCYEAKQGSIQGVVCS